MKQTELSMLTGLLHQASKLEHCLLDTYLYTASSIKSMPQEFELLSNGQPNKRRAIHFEKARQWKQFILNVSHEEMLHLHYVQCLLRALGQSPTFELPQRDPTTDDWIIPNWDIYQVGVPQGEGTQIPLDSLTINQIKRFILFESTDSLQDSNPFGPEILGLFQQLFDFELDFHLEGMLFPIVNDERREALKVKLLDIYQNLLPSDEIAAKQLMMAEFSEEELSYVRFQSIGDFYTKGILPLYQQAFDKKLVPFSNRTFNNEILGPAAAEGFLPVGPVYRSKNYSDFSSANAQNPLKYFKNVENIINEIVEEGEGFASFEEMANAFLAKVKEIGGTRNYLKAWKLDKKNARNPNYSTPEWLADAELCRQSHLYRFVMVYMDIQFENDLSSKSGVTFEAHRSPIAVDTSNHAIEKLISEMPKQFNACYMVMLMWLSRIYEIKDWQSDKDRRYAIEMIATWPLMSLAIRPFLELMSFFPVDLKNVFKIEAAALPNLPTDAIQLLSYFKKTDRNELINHEIDYLALRVLRNAAEWAQSQISIVQNNFTGLEADMVVTRLKGLSKLGEFEKQFPFRYHGGYSNQLPDTTYQQEYPDADDYSEDPSSMPNVFDDSLVLKLRFGGFGLVQLSTDPDPPTDEAGCSGTHMLHAADGDRKFDRAQVWQDVPGQKNIVREPKEQLSPLGVNLIDATLQITSKAGAQAGYVPLQIMQSAGAVQTSGVQQYLNVTGLNDLFHFSTNELASVNKPLKVNLLEKDGIRPYGYGDNHLVSKDGEPIDPFIVSITDGDYKNLFQREIYNEGKSMAEMNPMQRLKSARWPTGFDGNLNDIPSWFSQTLSPEYVDLLVNKGPMAYLTKRTHLLFNTLEDYFDTNPALSQAAVDEIISYAERMYLVSMPKGTTVGWLGVLLNYGHTVSGVLNANDDNNALFEYIAEKLQLKLSCCSPSAKDRTKPNSRWLIKYTEGIMDTDAISDMVYGELFIPLEVVPQSEPFVISKKWTFVKGMKEVLASYTCHFQQPFWTNDFDVEGNVRSITFPNRTKFTETLLQETPYGYSYSGEGMDGIHGYRGSFNVDNSTDEKVELTLHITFQYESADSFIKMTTIVGDFFQQVENALNSNFTAH